MLLISRVDLVATLNVVVDSSKGNIYKVTLMLDYLYEIATKKKH